MQLKTMTIVKHGFEWYVVFVHEETCTLSIVSDYGNYAYRWPAGGQVPGQRFKDFLLELNDGYLLSKICQGIPKEFDSAATLLRVKRELIENRREYGANKDAVREVWDSLDGLDLENALQDGHDEDLGQFCNYESMVFDYPFGAKTFLTKFWPEIKAQLKADLP